MKNRILSLLVIAALLIAFASTAQPAHADSPTFLFVLDCDHASLLITGATPGYFYDFLVFIPSESFGHLSNLQQVPASGTLEFTYAYPATYAIGTYIYSDTFQTPGPATGNPVAKMTQNCGVFGSVPTPPDFVMRTILCDTPVYDTPGGSPVGDNAVTTGQTWFGSTTSELAPDGSAWVAIFVAGEKTPYIPAQCVR